MADEVETTVHLLLVKNYLHKRGICRNTNAIVQVQYMLVLVSLLRLKHKFLPLVWAGLPVEVARLLSVSYRWIKTFGGSLFCL